MSPILLHCFIAFFLFHGRHLVLAQQQAAIENDVCTAAINVTSGRMFSDTFNTTGATSDNEICGEITSNDIGVWFMYKSEITTVVKVTIENPTFESRISVFEGSCGSLINCIDISTALSWVADAGVEYRLLVSGLAASTGQFSITIEGRETPSNDECTSAVKVTGNTPFFEEGNTNYATADFDELNNCASDLVRGVWYEYEATENRIVTIELTNPTFIYSIALFQGDSCPPTCITYASVGFLVPYTFPFQAESTEKYFILVTGYSTFDHVGTFSISIEEEDIPPNDTCDNATAIDFRRAGFSGNTVGATTEEEFSEAACNVASASRGVWFKYTPTANMNITLQTSSATFYHQIVVLQGESCNPTPSCDSWNPGYYVDSAAVTFTAFEAQQYYFLVTGQSDFGQVGTFRLTMTSDVTSSPSPRPINAPSAPTPTERPSLGPANVPTIAPATPPSQVATPPPNNPNTAQPTSSPITATMQPVMLVPTERPMATTALTDVPTEQPSERPTFPPAEQTSRPTQAPVAPPVNVPTTAPVEVPTEQPVERPILRPVEFPSRPASAPTPVVPPGEFPTNVPKTNPPADSDPSGGRTCPDGSPGPYFPDECDVDCPISGPSVPGCVKFCDVRPIFGCAPVCAGIVTAIVPGGCRERCCRDNNDTPPPTDLPTSIPIIGVIETTDSPTTASFDPVMTSYGKNSKGKGLKYYDDDYYSHTGKGRMHHHYSGSGKGKMYHHQSGKGKGKMHHHHYTGRDENDGYGNSDHGKSASRYHNTWEVTGWNERRRSHGQSHDAP